MTDDQLKAFPLPLPLKGGAERRLARLSGRSTQELWELFDRVNLLPYFPGRKARAPKHNQRTYRLHQSDGDTFPLSEARDMSSAVPIQRYAVVLLLGLNVARAFGVPSPALFKWVHVHASDNQTGTRQWRSG